MHVPPGAPGASSISTASPPSGRADSLVRHHAMRFLADSHAVGLSIGVYQGGMAHGYGFGVADLATRAPATPTTIYPIASLTKTFTVRSSLGPSSRDGCGSTTTSGGISTPPSPTSSFAANRSRCARS